MENTALKEQPSVDKTTPEELRVGDILSFTHWAKVEEVSRSQYDVLGTKITVTDLDSGNSFLVDGDNLIALCNSADQYSSESIVGSVAIVEILSNSNGKPFTVTFTKKDGTERTLRGRLIGVDQKNLGYIDVEDLDQPEGKRFRMVDCRTISSLIVDNTRFRVRPRKDRES